eukprot:TRINITY_DN94161_c0_g1_i1.p1 TRINITY_DN94161_c0_g1~~TRINITY_DN94161_c0_g1_i1.p1  ORF type:complete len:958 (-),score=207.50 TRINITY_DN94161_c0_g1_i1:255-2750(-)
MASELAREVERRADDFQRLKDRALQSLLRMKRAGELDKLARDLEATRSATASTTQPSDSAPSDALGSSQDTTSRSATVTGSADADTVDATPVVRRQRAVRRLLDMKRSGELSRLAKEMDEAQKQFEAKAAQLRELDIEAETNTSDLEQLAGEMTQVLETHMESIKNRVRNGLLRAHRTGELFDLKEELDELADEVSCSLEPSPKAPTSKRWSEMTSSESELDSRMCSPEKGDREDNDFVGEQVACKRSGSDSTFAARLDSHSDATDSSGVSKQADAGDIQNFTRIAEMLMSQHSMSRPLSRSNSGSKDPLIDSSDSAPESQQPTTVHEASESNPSARGSRLNSPNLTAVVSGGSQHTSPGDRKRDPKVQRRRRLARSLLKAKDSGQLQRLLTDLRHDQQNMVKSASDLQALKEKFKTAMLEAHRTGGLRSMASELAREVERRADDFQRHKERALQSLLRMKRAGELEKLAQELELRSAASPGSETIQKRTLRDDFDAGAVDASAGSPATNTSRSVAAASDEPNAALPQAPPRKRAVQSLLEKHRSGELAHLAEEMDEAQKKFEAKAAQLRMISKEVSGNTGELVRLAGEMEQVLETQVETIRSRVRNGLLRAHRAGELWDLRDELDELADEVPEIGMNSSCHGSQSPERRRGLPWNAGKADRRRWCDMTSSDSDHDPSRGQVMLPQSSGGEDDSEGGRAGDGDSDFSEESRDFSDADQHVPAAPLSWMQDGSKGSKIESASALSRDATERRRWADMATSSDSDLEPKLQFQMDSAGTATLAERLQSSCPQGAARGNGASESLQSFLSRGASSVTEHQTELNDSDDASNAAK